MVTALSRHAERKVPLLLALVRLVSKDPDTLSPKRGRKWRSVAERRLLPVKSQKVYQGGGGGGSVARSGAICEPAASVVLHGDATEGSPPEGSWREAGSM